MQKKISIIGSTGSIGTNTLKVARHLGPEKIHVTALAAAGSNKILLEEQIKEFQPKFVGIFNEEIAAEFKKKFPYISIEGGLSGVIEAAKYSEISLAVCAISGTIGLLPTIAAIEAGKDIALANKEALVSAGEFIMSSAARQKINIIPIDSEHSAIFQCLEGEKKKNVAKIILTASGGPFLNYSLEKLSRIKIEDALKHPNWQMGAKITIDSSTLMNKGLEVIEAYWLFNIPKKNIEVIIHPQSIIHSLVEFIDGSILAQMSIPTMVIPIQYALTYPNREKGILEPFNFIKNSKLEFFNPDMERFKCLKLAFETLKEGGSTSCYLNAANEILVKRFLHKEISWMDISSKLETLLQKHEKKKINCIDDVLHVDALAKEEASKV